MTVITEQRRCWCGHSQFITFSTEYIRCTNCGTLVSQVGLSTDQLQVRDDSQDFYGREYWFTHQEQDLGYNNILDRARLDLSERCLHWLRTLLKYKLPHGLALELGSAHGGFVALLQWAGFVATGLELSPWVVEFARQTFDVPMLLGPAEDQRIEPGMLDVIALMDVLEHLPDPLGTMRHCLGLLKPDGILLIQTPCYPEDSTYEAMRSTNAPFLEQLKSNEHLYLFSKSSIRKLFHTLAAEHLAFEPAIFGHYDMFLAVSRSPLTVNHPEAIEQALSNSAAGRMVQALLDVDDKRLEVEHKLAVAEADRVVRLRVIEGQGQRLGMIEAQRNLLQAEVSELHQHLAHAEADRSVRLDIIQAQGQRLGELEAARNILQQELVDQTTHLREQLRTTEAHVRKQQHILQSIQSDRLYRLLRRARQWEWFEAALAEISATGVAAQVDGEQQDNTASLTEVAAQVDGEQQDNTASFGQLLSAYRVEIDAFNNAQPNKELLDQIRRYNHLMVDEFDTICPLKGSLFLDIGASPHGYALERALQHGATLYVGVGLDVHSPSYVVGDMGGAGLILQMDATALQFPDAMFDLVLSISTFEHVSDASLVLNEIARVLKPDGRALVSFEPIWTCSYGHHLHHFDDCAKVVPPWAHLMWNPEEMRENLRNKWPPDAPVNLEQAIEWVYHSDAINRVDIRQFQALFRACPLKVEWVVDLKEPNLDLEAAEQAARMTGFSVEELTTKGLSVLLVKQSD